MSEIADGQFGAYSRGNKQKIMIAAALMHEPKLLLVDEPMVGLDPESVRTTMRLLVEFTDRGGAVLMATHTLLVAQQMCHRIGILVDGRLAEEGRLAQLKEKAGMVRGSLEDFYVRLVHRI